MSLSLIKKQIRDRLWILLEAEPTFAALARQRNRLDTVAGWLRASADIRSPGDLFRIAISDGRWTSSAFQEAQTFAEENDGYLSTEGGASTWPLKVTAEYIIELEVDYSKADKEDNFEEAAHVALLSGGPRLGNENVITWGINAQRSPRDMTQKSPPPRLITKLRLNANLLVDGRSFITTS